MSIRSSASRLQVRSANQAIYAASFRCHVHALIEMGYVRLRPVDYRQSEEPEITGELIDAMRTAMADVDVPPWVRHYTIHDDPPLSHGGRRGKHRRRVDIEFERVGLGKRPRFQFEAKRLNRKSADYDYCGDEGLGCFLAGEYAHDHSEAGMLGYVQTENEPTWAARIQVRLKGNAKTYSILPNGGWERVKTTSRLRFTYRTRHDRTKSLGPITISHILLKLC